MTSELQLEEWPRDWNSAAFDHSILLPLTERLSSEVFRRYLCISALLVRIWYVLPASCQSHSRPLQSLLSWQRCRSLGYIQYMFIDGI